MVKFSAYFVEETHSFGAKILQKLERNRSVKVEKKNEIGVLVPIMDFVSRQHFWLFHGKTSQTGEVPSVGLEVGVGTTSRLSTDFRQLSFGLSRKGVKPHASKYSEVVTSGDQDSSVVRSSELSIQRQTREFTWRSYLRRKQRGGGRDSNEEERSERNVLPPKESIATLNQRKRTRAKPLGRIPLERVLCHSLTTAHLLVQRT